MQNIYQQIKAAQQFFNKKDKMLSPQLSQVVKTPVSFDDLPDEVIIRIFSYLSDEEKRKVIQVCKKFHDIIHGFFLDSFYGKTIRFNKWQLSETSDSIEDAKKLIFSSQMRLGIVYLLLNLTRTPFKSALLLTSFTSAITGLSFYIIYRLSARLIEALLNDSLFAAILASGSLGIVSYLGAMSFWFTKSLSITTKELWEPFPIQYTKVLLLALYSLTKPIDEKTVIYLLDEFSKKHFVSFLVIAELLLEKKVYLDLDWFSKITGVTLDNNFIEELNSQGLLSEDRKKIILYPKGDLIPNIKLMNAVENLKPKLEELSKELEEYLTNAAKHVVWKMGVNEEDFSKMEVIDPKLPSYAKNILTLWEKSNPKKETLLAQHKEKPVLQRISM